MRNSIATPSQARDKEILRASVHDVTILLGSGDTLQLPAAGARAVFRRTAAETGGRAVVFELYLEPSGFLPALHVHPHQQERLEVLAGSVGTQVGRRRAVVGPGARLTVPAGEAHRLWNAGDETAQLVVEVTPALRLEPLLLALHALGADGRRLGRLQLAGLAAAHFDTVRLPIRPALLQRLALALAAPLGRIS